MSDAESSGTVTTSDTTTTGATTIGQADVVIVGGGLAGLHAAWLLQRHGLHDHLVLEARDVTGGRIAPLGVPRDGRSAAADTPAAYDRFDLGPTWFWPALQPELDRLIEALGLARFRQFETGHLMAERTPDLRAVRMHGFAGEPPSMRLAGSMSALTDALRAPLDPDRLRTGTVVLRLCRRDDHVEVHAVSADGTPARFQARHVLLAVPPRLAVGTIAFEPPLPAPLHDAWVDTATWMAPHAKYLAVFEAPLWREAGLSGAARSACGPMVEIHDASLPDGAAALFGFIGVPASVRRDVPADVLRTHCRAQLVRLFGPKAGHPRVDAIKDWAQDPFTATAADREGPGHHAVAPPSVAQSGPWAGRLTGIASEWSPQFPGYVAGAIEASGIGVRRLLPPA